LATSIALSGRRVLLIDVDPQGNLTSGVGLKGAKADAGTVYEALMTDAEPESFVIPTRVENLFAIPADRNLTGAEIELVPMLAREHRLKRIVGALRGQFDDIFIDCPPSLGLLTLNALVAADAVLIPLHCEYFALEGLADLVGTMRLVRTALNPGLDIEGVLLTMYDDRTNLGQLVARDVREFFKDKVFNTIIPRNVRLGEAPSHGVPAVLYDVKSRGAAAYVALAKEMLARRAA
jgi:chromosome partitioning protein